MPRKGFAPKVHGFLPRVCPRFAEGFAQRFAFVLGTRDQGFSNRFGSKTLLISVTCYLHFEDRVLIYYDDDIRSNARVYTMDMFNDDDIN